MVSSSSTNSTSAVDIYSAAAYSDLESLGVFVDREKPLLSQPNGSGHYALQWACSRNHADIAKYIVEHGGEVDAVDSLQQTALHWAAAQGAVAAAEVLLERGASVEAADVHGYRAVHFAAQYGQTGFLNYIVSKHGADLNAVDNEGKSPLHWAAYKECADTVRLLVFRDAFLGSQDKEDRTPLHWAAIRGNAEICVILLYAGTEEELSVKDSSGFTPPQLAADNGHHHVAYLLSNAIVAHGRSWGNKICSERMANIGYAPVLLVVIIFLMVLFINSVLGASNLPKITVLLGLWTCVGFTLAFGSLLMFYRCSSKDPGYIKSRTRHLSRQTDDALLDIDLDNSSTWTGNWSQLCSTCKIIRPIRSKHCTTCNRCVELFDHHCPWISNCVGKGNKRDFYVMTLMGTLPLLMAAVITFERLQMAFLEPPLSKSWFHHVVTENPGAFVFLVVDIFLLIGTSTLTIAQTAQIAQNIMTNEMVNASRYAYLRGPDGKYRNPFSRGCRKNCTDFFINGHGNDVEMARASL